VALLLVYFEKGRDYDTSCLALNRWRFIIYCGRPAIPVSCYIHICC